MLAASLFELAPDLPTTITDAQCRLVLALVASPTAKPAAEEPATVENAAAALAGRAEEPVPDAPVVHPGRPEWDDVMNVFGLGVAPDELVFEDDGAAPGHIPDADLARGAAAPDPHARVAINAEAVPGETSDIQ